MGFSYLPAYRGRNGTYLVLLRVGFAKLLRSLSALVSSYLAFSPLPTYAKASVDGIFSVALSLSHLFGDRTVRVTDHPALRSSDFPPPDHLPLRAMMRSGHLFPFQSPLS